MNDGPMRAPLLLAVSLKMYFDLGQTREWCDRLARLVARHPAAIGDHVELVVLPSFPALAAAADSLSNTGVAIGAQDLYWEDSGPFTGQVSGVSLTQVGCTYVEVGHAERRRLFGDDDDAVTRKTEAALRNGLVPLLCVGETERTGASDAAAFCVRQLASALEHTLAAGVEGDLVVAYEPVWAIGSTGAASDDHILVVVRALRDWLDAQPRFAGTRIIYGGSAGPGVLQGLLPDIDGLFLGRFVHNPDALEAMLDETMQYRKGGSENMLAPVTDLRNETAGEH